MATKIIWYAKPYGIIESSGTAQWMCGDDDQPSQSMAMTKIGPPAQTMRSRRYSGFFSGCLALSRGTKLSYHRAVAHPVNVPSPTNQSCDRQHRHVRGKKVI